MSRYDTYTSGASFASPRITWAVQRLIFACTIVFALQLVAGPLQLLLFAGMPLTDLLMFEPGSFFLRGHLWSVFTYQFMHSGLLHLFMNMLWLFFFGPEVERVLGTRGFFKFYLVCGCVSVLATAIPFLLQGSNPSVVGASGAVMAVLVAFAMIDPQRQLYLFPIPFPITALALVVIIAALNLVSGLQESHVSVATHFGGMGAGYLYMKFLPQMNNWSRDWRRSRQVKPGRNKSTGTKPDLDKIGEEVDNIFKFRDHDKRR